MKRFFTVLGSMAGGWIGWVLGAKVGFMTGYFASVVGTALGVYYGRRLENALLD